MSCRLSPVLLQCFYNEQLSPRVPNALIRETLAIAAHDVRPGIDLGYAGESMVQYLMLRPKMVAMGRKRSGG